MPPNSYEPDAVTAEAPPRIDASASYQPRDVPATRGARRLKNDANPAARGETVTFDAVPKGSRWESVDSFAVKVRRTGKKS